MKIYHVRNIDEDYETNPFIVAEGPQEAYEKAQTLEFVGVYFTDELRDEGDIEILELGIDTLYVTRWYWCENLQCWEIDTTWAIEKA
jgi:hypothetical protein